MIISSHSGPAEGLRIFSFSFFLFTPLVREHESFNLSDVPPYVHTVQAYGGEVRAARALNHKD